MPQITSIIPQKKSKNRLNIYLDGNFAFGLNEEVVLRNNLKVGKSLTQNLIDEILAKEELIKLTDLAANFLSFRPRSEKEVRNYLAKKISQRSQIPFRHAVLSPLLEKVIQKLKKYKYLNDEEFALWLVNSRLRSKSKSPKQIKIELKLKGIETSLIEKILQKLVNEEEIAKKVLEKKIPKWENLKDAEFKKKCYQYLSQKGFDYDVIQSAFAFFSKKR